MDKDVELMADHLPLEEVLISDIEGIAAPPNWSRAEDDEAHELPPVLIEEDRGYSLVGNHRTVWHLKNNGRTMVKCLVVRSAVHVRPAHALISNCTEEAMLFEGLLRREIVANRSRLADMLGYSRARITQLLNLLKLPRYIRQRVLITDEISEFQLRQLLKVIDDQMKLKTGFQKLLEKKLSGRQMALFASAEHTDEGIDPEGEVLSPVILNETAVEEESDSMSELEEMFHDEVTENVQAPGPVHGPSVKKAEPVPAPPRTTVAKESPDMTGILRDIGSLRETGWRIKAAEYMLPQLQMDFLEGVSTLRNGLYTKAMDILSEVVAEDSSHHLAWFYLGRCANLTGSLQEGEEYLRNAVSRSPENPDYLVELAIVLEKLKRHSEAEVFYRKAAVIRKKAVSGR